MINRNNKTLKVSIYSLFFMFLGIVSCYDSGFEEFTPPTGNVNNIQPNTLFTSSPKAGDNLSVIFRSYSTDAVSYAWDFGDGNTSTEANPDYTYTEGGLYNVKLITTSSDGLQALKKDTNFFLNAPIKDWSADLGGVSDYKEITFLTQESEKQSKKAAGLLGEQLTATLNQINNYFGVIEQAMVTYASQPTRENLEGLQQQLSNAANFNIENILVCSDK